MRKSHLLITTTVALLLTIFSTAFSQDSLEAEKAAIMDRLNKYYRDASWNSEIADVDAVLKVISIQSNDINVRSNGEFIIRPNSTFLETVKRNGARRPSFLKGIVTFKYPVIDITGNAAVIIIEIYDDDKIIATDYFGLFKFRDGWKIVVYPMFWHNSPGERPPIIEGDAEAIKKVVEDSFVKGILESGDTVTAMKGFTEITDINIYHPNVDAIGKPNLAFYLRPLASRKPLPLKNYEVSIIGVTGTLGAAKLNFSVESNKTITYYLHLFKLKDGWKIGSITTANRRAEFLQPPTQ